MVSSHRACGSAAGAALLPVYGWDLSSSHSSRRLVAERQSCGRDEPGRGGNAGGAYSPTGAGEGTTVVRPRRSRLEAIAAT